MSLSCPDCGPEGGVSLRDGTPRCPKCGRPLPDGAAASSPAPQAGTRLRLVHEATKTLIALPESGTLAIGREGSPLASLLESDLGISRRHAEIVASGGGYLLRHLAPSNQTELLAPSPRTQRTLLAPGASERLEAGHRIRLQTHFLLVEAVPPPREEEPKRDAQRPTPTPSGAQADTPPPTPSGAQAVTPPPPPMQEAKPARCKSCSHSHAITPAVDANGTWACENCLEPNQAAVAR